MYEVQEWVKVNGKLQKVWVGGYRGTDAAGTEKFAARMRTPTGSSVRGTYRVTPTGRTRFVPTNESSLALLG